MGFGWSRNTSGGQGAPFGRWFWLPACGGFFLSVALAFGLVEVHRQRHPQPLQLRAVDILSEAGQGPLRLRLRGEGFDRRTRVNLVMDTGHRGAVAGILETPGTLEQVRVAGDMAYLASNWAGVQVVDISEPPRPRVLGVERASFKSAWDLAVDGHLLFVSDAKQGLVVLDVSDPRRPEKIGSFVTADPCMGIAHSPSQALVLLAQGKHGVLVLDVSNPRAPREVSRLGSVGFAWNVRVQDRRVFVADGNGGLRIFDLEDPAHPQFLGQLSGKGHVRALEVRENLVFLLTILHGLQVIDVAEPRLPRTIGTLAVPGTPWDLRLRDDHLYVANNISGILSVDISNPRQPRQLGLVHVARAARGLDVAGDHVFVAGSRQGLLVVDRSRVAPLQAWLEIPLGGRVQALARDGMDLFAAVTKQGLRHFKLGDEGLILGSNPFGESLHGKQGVAFGRHLFIAGGEGGLQILEMLEPGRLERVGELRVPGFAHRVLLDAEGPRAFLATGGEGLLVLDVSSPQEPRVLQHIPDLGNVVDLVICADQVAALDQGGRIHLLEWSENRRLRLRESVALPDLLGNLAWDGEALYANGLNAALWHIRLDQGRAGRPRSVAEPGLRKTQLQINGERLYLSGLSQGGGQDLEIYQLRVGQMPQRLARISFQDISGRFHFVEDALYFVREGRLETWDLSRPEEPRQADVQVYATHFAALVVADNEMFALAANGGLRRLDRSDPLRPRPRTLTLDSFTEVLDMSVLGDCLLILDRNAGLHLFSRSPDAKPASLAALGFPRALQAWYRDAERLYLIDDGGRLYVVDLGDLPNLRVVAEGDLGTGTISQIRVRDGLLYAAARKEGLKAWDIRDARQPRLLGKSRLPWPQGEFSSAQDLDFSGPRILVADGDAGLSVYEETGTGVPRLLDTVRISGFCRRIRVEDNLAFVMSSREGIYLVDVGGVGRPQLISHLPAQGTVDNFWKEKDRLWLAREDGLSAIPLPLPATRVLSLGDQSLEVEFAVAPAPGIYTLQLVRGAEKQELAGALHLAAGRQESGAAAMNPQNR
ncbi:hypothetical protein [Geoalkalibacter sp.]|uniref:hypothetical protein n=1 Tax=Geoalkalibacter sp. TaxID=3041440 RepID=UPI00272DD8B5|nr:hypothetical protein [Geoalkalibacter sp.]